MATGSMESSVFETFSFEPPFLAFFRGFLAQSFKIPGTQSDKLVHLFNQHPKNQTIWSNIINDKNVWNPFNLYIMYTCWHVYLKNDWNDKPILEIETHFLSIDQSRAALHTNYSTYLLDWALIDTGTRTFYCQGQNTDQQRGPIKTV